MNKQEIISRLETFAPPELQEDWDCSGWVVDLPKNNIKNVMYALTVTDDVYNQALNTDCDLIIAHHPLFTVPLKYKNIQIYCAHTNLDKAKGGTTDTLISILGFQPSFCENEFVRVVNLDNPITISELEQKLRKVSPNLRYVNNTNTKQVKSIAFCTGSGSEFLNETSADCFVTGDLKYHTACETKKVVFDIGHFESEVLIKNKLREITGIEGILADEKSPFIY